MTTVAATAAAVGAGRPDAGGCRVEAAAGTATGRRRCRNAGGAAGGRWAAGAAAQRSPWRGRSATAPGSVARRPCSRAVVSADERDDDGDADRGPPQQRHHRRDTEQTAIHATPPPTAAAGHFRSRAVGHATHCTSGYATCTAEVCR